MFFLLRRMPGLESQKWKQKKFRSIPAGKWGYLQKNRTQASLDSETISRQRNQVMNCTPAKSLSTCRSNRIASVHVHGFRKSVTPYYWHVLFMCVYAHEHMEVTGQLVDIHSLPLSCDCQGSNLGHQAWQEPLGDISMPYFNFLLFINNKYKHIFFETGSYYVAYATLKLELLLSQAHRVRTIGMSCLAQLYNWFLFMRGFHYMVQVGLEHTAVLCLIS